MHDTGIKLLNLMFRSGETICVSPSKYGYHSVPLERVLSGRVTLVSPNADREHEYINSSELLMVALNPIQGFRTDIGCTSWRNFLVEMDHGTLESQMEYAKNISLPYSAVIFSGNKSLHFLISLDEDIPDEATYRKFSQWTLSIATAADQNTKNPSRSIRIPGALREPGKQQKLVEFRGVTPYYKFLQWLQEHPGCEPKEREKRERSEFPDLAKVSMWAARLLIEGLDPTKGRNKQWFSIACEFALAGFSDHDTLDILSEYFIPDRDFTEREWKTSVESAFKYVYERKS
jgi:hypothetical protein